MVEAIPIDSNKKVDTKRANQPEPLAGIGLIITKTRQFKAQIFTSRSLADDAAAFVEKLELDLAEQVTAIEAMIDDHEDELSNSLDVEDLRDVASDISGALMEILDRTPDAYLRRRISVLARGLVRNPGVDDRSSLLVPTQSEMVAQAISLSA